MNLTPLIVRVYGIPNDISDRSKGMNATNTIPRLRLESHDDKLARISCKLREDIVGQLGDEEAKEQEVWIYYPTDAYQHRLGEQIYIEVDDVGLDDETCQRIAGTVMLGAGTIIIEDEFTGDTKAIFVKVRCEHDAHARWNRSSDPG